MSKSEPAPMPPPTCRTVYREVRFLPRYDRYERIRAVPCEAQREPDCAVAVVDYEHGGRRWAIVCYLLGIPASYEPVAETRTLTPHAEALLGLKREADL